MLQPVSAIQNAKLAKAYAECIANLEQLVRNFVVKKRYSLVFEKRNILITKSNELESTRISNIFIGAEIEFFLNVFQTEIVRSSIG